MPEKPNRLIKKKDGIPNAEVAKKPRMPFNIIRRPIKRIPMERIQS